MNDELYTITQSYESEIRVKNSRFISWLAPAKSRTIAERKIGERSKIFKDATHNCFAFRVGVGEEIISYSNDAHEPAGTAGRPILQALEIHNLVNIAAVVTRYFGGTKLGIGGLIRAYGGAANAVIEAAQLIPTYPTVIYRLHYQYQDSPAVEKALNQSEAKIIQSDFGSEVKRVVELRPDHAVAFLNLLKELSSGRVSYEKIMSTDNR